MRRCSRKRVTQTRRSTRLSSQASQPSQRNRRRSPLATVARRLLFGDRAQTANTRRGTHMEENAGNLIRSLRQKLGMTQEEFAHEIAVTVSTVNRWEHAHAEPSKLAWKAIHDLARKRGLTDDI